MKNETMTIIELAEKFKIEIPDFISEYSNQIEDITSENYQDLESVVEYTYYQDHISEYADSNTPIYYSDIDERYNRQVNNNGYCIDDAIYEGLCEPMESESDISHSKQVAIYMQIEQDTYEEIRDFVSELENLDLDEIFGEGKEEA